MFGKLTALATAAALAIVIVASPAAAAGESGYKTCSGVEKLHTVSYTTGLTSHSSHGYVETWANGASWTWRLGGGDGGSGSWSISTNGQMNYPWTYATCG